MKELTLKSHRFRQEREAEWRKLEDILARAEASSAAKLSDEEIIALPVLYRSALSSLSVARAISLDQSLIAYLESLCTRAYFFVYGTRTTMLKRILAFFSRDWPRARARLVARDRDRCGSHGAGRGCRLCADACAIRPGSIRSSRPHWPMGADPRRRPKSCARRCSRKGKAGCRFSPPISSRTTRRCALLAFALGFAFCLPAALPGSDQRSDARAPLSRSSPRAGWAWSSAAG